VIKLLSPQQVADLLGVKLCTIYQWRSEGYIPCVKLGRALRFDPRVIEVWIKKCSEEGRTTREIDLKELGL
jgi:excisionase family DNA binding protein